MYIVVRFTQHIRLLLENKIPFLKQVAFDAKNLIYLGNQRCPKYTNLINLILIDLF